jgi:hypothetical protein
MMPYDLVAILLITVAIFLPLYLHEKEERKRECQLVQFLRLVANESNKKEEK